MAVKEFIKLTFLFFTINLFSTSCSHEQNKTDTELYKRLVEELVEDPKKEQPYIYPASIELRAIGKRAWPVLFEHLNDKRRSTAFAEVIPPHDVAHAVYYTLLNQVNCMPPGYYRSKIRRGPTKKYVDYAGRYLDISQKSVQKWLEQRSHLSLNEIKLQSAIWTLNRDNEAGYPDEDEKKRIQGILTKEISRLKKLIQKEKEAFKEPEIAPELVNILNTKIILKIPFNNEEFEMALGFLQNILNQKRFYFINFSNSFPKETFSLKTDNLTVKDFLDEICKQTGVSYKLGKRVILFNYRPSGK